MRVGRERSHSRRGVVRWKISSGGIEDFAGQSVFLK